MNAMKTRGSYEKRDETTIDRIRSTDRFALNDRELSMGKGRLDSQNILYMYSCCRFSVRGRNPASSREPVKRIVAATYCGRINWENWEEHRCDLVGVWVLSASLWHFIGLGPITQNKADSTRLYIRGRERDIYTRTSYIMYKQFVKQIQLASSLCLSLPRTPSSPVSSNVQKESKMQSRRRTDWLTDWQVKSVDRNLPHPSQRLNAEPVRRLISLSLAIRWRCPVKPLHTSPPPWLCQCKQMHWELFATCSNIIKFQNRLTARGANCSFYFKQQQQRLALSLSLSDCLTVSSRLCCAKLIIQTEQNSSSSSSSRAPWIILINPAWDSISYTSIAIEMSWACKLCNERRSPALSAFSLTHTLVLSLFLSFFDCLLPWNTSVAT